jgi:predicted dehydrogenase
MTASTSDAARAPATSEVPTGSGAPAGSGAPLRVAIAGCHRMLARQPGGHNWAAGFFAVPETRVVAVYDAGAETRRAFVECWSGAWAGDDIVAYADYVQMLREARPDVVCIATRQTQHADQVERAVAQGVRGILCDKPLATSLAEMDRIVAACARGEVPLAFGLDRRWTRRYRWARALLADGAVGRVQTVMAYGLLNLVNHGCHWYDAALWLAGDPEVAWVSGLVEDVSAEAPDSPRRLDPPGRAQIGLANGVTVYVTPDGRPGPAFEVLGDRGRLLLLDDARASSLWRSDSPGGPLRPTDFVAAGLPAPPETPPGWEAGPGAVADLVAAVRTGVPTACGPDEARRATEIGFAIHASSAADGRRLRPEEWDRTLRVESLPWGNE